MISLSVEWSVHCLFWLDDVFQDELRRFEAQHNEMVAKTDEMTKEIEGMETASVMIKRSNETAKVNVDKLQ